MRTSLLRIRQPTKIVYNNLPIEDMATFLLRIWQPEYWGYGNLPIEDMATCLLRIWQPASWGYGNLPIEDIPDSIMNTTFEICFFIYLLLLFILVFSYFRAFIHCKFLTRISIYYLRWSKSDFNINDVDLMALIIKDRFIDMKKWVKLFIYPVG